MKAVLVGSIYKVFDEERRGSGFRKRKFWLRELFPTPGRLKNTWVLEMQYDNCDTLEWFLDPAREVECEVEIRGSLIERSASEDRVYNTLVCINIKFKDQ